MTPIIRLPCWGWQEDSVILPSVKISRQCRLERSGMLEDICNLRATFRIVGRQRNLSLRVLVHPYAQVETQHPQPDHVTILCCFSMCCLVVVSLVKSDRSSSASMIPSITRCSASEKDAHALSGWVSGCHISINASNRLRRVEARACKMRLHDSYVTAKSPSAMDSLLDWVEIGNCRLIHKIGVVGDRFASNQPQIH